MRRPEAPLRALIRNIGQIVSGDIARPLIDGDSIVADGGKIVAIGRGLDDDADTVIDARGSTVVPGLIDSHCHPVFGDFTPRQRTIDFIESGLNGGITTMISAGEVHLPGRPKDIVGLKALAIVAAKAYANLRPAGVKMHAGAPILELGMVEEDFAEMARAGVKLVGEIGLGSVRTGKDAAPMVKWARKHGMTVTIHTGGPSIAGSNAIGGDVVLEADPDVVGHINGGTTSMSEREIDEINADRDRNIAIARGELEPDDGDVVVALIGDEATVKRIYFEGDRVRFQPSNPRMAPIYVREADFKSTMILGVVVGVYRKLT